jgi:hypothetical protein
MKVGRYTLENLVKAQAALAAVGKDIKKLLVEYDRRGGLIKEETKVDGHVVYVPVPLGTFWDFNKNAPRKVPLKERVKALVRPKRK